MPRRTFLFRSLRSLEFPNLLNLPKKTALLRAPPRQSVKHPAKKTEPRNLDSAKCLEVIITLRMSPKHNCSNHTQRTCCHQLFALNYPNHLSSYDPLHQDSYA